MKINVKELAIQTYWEASCLLRAGMERGIVNKDAYRTLCVQARCGDLKIEAAARGSLSLADDRMHRREETA